MWGSPSPPLGPSVWLGVNLPISLASRLKIHGVLPPSTLSWRRVNSQDQQYLSLFNTKISKLLNHCSQLHI